MSTYYAGVLLFTRYVFPCADKKRDKGQITLADRDWLENVTLGRTNPSGWLLEYCFRSEHGAIASYKNCDKCKTEGFRPDYSQASVSNHWRNHHGHDGDCAVKIATVCAVDTLGAIVISGSETFVAINFYKLPVTVGNTVTVHSRTIIEVL